MDRISFKFDIEKDTLNLWESVNFESSWANVSRSLPQKLINLCKNKRLEECKEEIKEMNSNIYKSSIIPATLTAIETGWREIETPFFDRINKMFGRSIDPSLITCYLTTSPRCPYNPKDNNLWFMASIHKPIYGSVKTCGHEISHLYFHKFYEEKLLKKLTKEKFADLKEALTVLLNLEFSDLFIARDNGYLVHKELRDFISKEWVKSRNLDDLINKCINKLGRN